MSKSHSRWCQVVKGEGIESVALLNMFILGLRNYDQAMAPTGILVPALNLWEKW